MVRLFVAIDLPESQRRDLEALCHGLTRKTRWTPPGQLHLTLRFIGGVDDCQVQLIKKALADITFKPFILQVQGLGCFPSQRQPKILWAGVEENLDLAQLQGRIESRLVQVGLVPEDRRFHPHLTLARLPPSFSPDILGAYLAENRQLKFTPFRVEQFHLYSSILSRHGASHHLEESFGVGRI